jgi:hypothetical protein
VSSRSPQVSPLFAVLAAALLALSLYAITLRGTWVYDDVFIARNDPRVQDVAKWKDYLVQGYWEPGSDHLWRPLASLSFAVQWRLSGGRGWAFHLVNILLHATASALVAALAWKLAGRRAAWIAGLLFAGHPLHVEDVASLVGRCETLAAVGVLGALVLLIRPPDKPMTWKRAAGIFGCFLLAIFSKEQGLLLPLMMAAWVMATRTGWPSDGAPASLAPAGRQPLTKELSRGPQGVLLMLLLWSTAAYVVYREHILPWAWDRQTLDWTHNPLVRSIGSARWLIPVAALGRYAALLLFPWRLSPDYTASVFTSTFQNGPYFYLGLAALLAYLVAWIVAIRRRSIPAVFCLACLGLTYFMVSNIILIGVIFAERLMYLPSAFILILFAVWAARWPRRWVVGVMTILLIPASMRTVTYAARWNDLPSLYEQSYRDYPQSAFLGLSLAMELRREGNLTESARVLAQTCEQNPTYWRAWYLAAQVAMERGRLDEADRLIQRASNLAPQLVAFFGLPNQLIPRHLAATHPAATTSVP